VTHIIDASTRKRLAPAVAEYVNTHGFQPKYAFESQLIVEAFAAVQGRILWVEYVSRKIFEDEGKREFIFHHDFEGKKKPYLASGQLQSYVLGGGYTVTPHGIEDDASDKREHVTTGRFQLDLRAPPSLTGMGIMQGFGIETADGEKKDIDFSKGPRCILAYNHEPGVKQLFIVQVSKAKRAAL